jgi:hypothetical protein
VDPGSMVADNGWIISYDMEAARLLGRNGLQSRLTPDVLFDEGYCTWNGVYPGDHIDSIRERERITVLAKTDPREYLQRLKSWANERMTRLQNEGWRKAKNAARSAHIAHNGRLPGLRNGNGALGR